MLVLLSALMHAGWNLIAKLGSDGLVAMAIIKAPNLLIAAAVLAVVGLPAPASWPYLLGSTFVNCLYFYFLINAYRVGDLSLAYPVARGTAPLLVLLLSMAFAGEVPTASAFVGVTVICMGIFIAGAQRKATRQHYATLLWAGGVGFCIAMYTVSDGIGARLSGNPVGYVAVLNIFTGIAVCGTAAWTRGPALAQAMRSHWKKGLFGGMMMLASYTIVVYALTLAPMAHVAALRESSVIFAAILGALFLREPFGRQRLAAAVAVAAGIGILVFAR
jgi:drug/metabolite transporter (DMT)-like permease